MPATLRREAHAAMVKIVAALAQSPEKARRPPRELRLDADEAMLRWARSIARGVCDDVRKGTGDARFSHGSDAVREVEGTAILQLVYLMQRYDESRCPPEKDVVTHFRQYSSKWIRKEASREAERIRNGGTYRTSAVAAVRCGPLPVSADGFDEVTDPASLEDVEEWDELPAARWVGPPVTNARAEPGDTRAAFAAMRKKLNRG